MVSVSENALSSVKTSTSNLNYEKLHNSETNLLYKSNSRSISNAFLPFLSEICELRLHSVNRVLTSNLNINFVRNKFHHLNDTVLMYIYILILTKTKLDKTFLNLSFWWMALLSYIDLIRINIEEELWFVFGSQFQVRF